MILPPLVEVVLTHVSTVKLSGPGTADWVEARPAPVPLKVDAVFESPRIAPLAPPPTPVPAVRSFQAAQSATFWPVA